MKIFNQYFIVTLLFPILSLIGSPEFRTYEGNGETILVFHLTEKLVYIGVQGNAQLLFQIHPTSKKGEPVVYRYSKSSKQTISFKEKTEMIFKENEEEKQYTLKSELIFKEKGTYNNKQRNENFGIFEADNSEIIIGLLYGNEVAYYFEKETEDNFSCNTAMFGILKIRFKNKVLELESGKDKRIYFLK